MNATQKRHLFTRQESTEVAIDADSRVIHAFNRIREIVSAFIVDPKIALSGTLPGVLNRNRINVQAGYAEPFGCQPG